MTAIRDSMILIIATNGFEQSEPEVPRDKLRAAGAWTMASSPAATPMIFPRIIEAVAEGRHSRRAA